MKSLLNVSFLNLVLLSIVLTAAAQNYPDSQEPVITGWADDSNYLIKEYDEGTRPVMRKVNVRTGRSSIVQEVKTSRDLLFDALPAGVSSDTDDILSPDEKSLVILKENDLYSFTIGGDKGSKRLTNDTIEEVNPRFSPDGKKIAYTKNKDLYYYDLSAGREVRLTFDASEKIYNGYASWVYMEEILGRPSRYAAFWWAPDGNRIAYLRTDETDVPTFTLNRLDEEDGVHGKLEVVPYPYAGDPNPKVKMGIAELSSGKTTWVKTDYSVDQYLAWPFWTNDGKKLAVQVLNRDQNDLKIILADASTGEYSEIYNEKRNTWVEFYETIHVMTDGTGFIVKSYRNDWENLYYYGWNGKLIAQLTDFDFRVTGIQRVDEEVKTVYFYATGTESTDNHLFRVGLDGKNLVRITKGEGTHVVSISPKGSYFIDIWSSISNPGGIVALDKNGAVVREIKKSVSPLYNPSAHSKAEMVKIKTADGMFSMPAVITYPVNFDSSKKYPVIFTIYGGPDMKNVKNVWSGSGPSWYSRNNIITFTVDHRGSGHFGRKGLDQLYRNLGKWEIADYSEAVKWLRAKPFVDPARIGITGSSYGGYMTCLALTIGSDYWTHGFAGSPVTDWRLYDNVYTERFMDKPSENAEGYRNSSALQYAGRLKGRFYLAHGDLDDNVHMQNSIQLISKLQDEGKTFQFMLYPNARHGWAGLKAAHYRNEMNNFWLKSFFGDFTSGTK